MGNHQHGLFVFIAIPAANVKRGTVMNKPRNGPGRGLESRRSRGPRLYASRGGENGKKDHERPCARPGCSRKRGRGRTDKLYCSNRCRYKARDEELIRLRKNDFEALVEERACPECRGNLLEAVGEQ